MISSEKILNQIRPLPAKEWIDKVSRATNGLSAFLIDKKFDKDNFSSENILD